MSIHKLLLPALVSGALLCTGSGLWAQTYSHGHEDGKAEINFAELAAYYKAHPTPLVRKPVFDEDERGEDVPFHKAADPSQVHLIREDAPERRGGSGSGGSAYLPVSVSPVDTFLSTTSNGTSIPPDTHGAVDSNYCFTVTNSTVRVQTRTGANVSSITLDNFWTSVLTVGAGSFDPRIHYDPYYNRWIVVTFAYGESANSQIMIAVSKTSSPLSGWWMYRVAVDASGATWLDFPNVGFNKKWLTVTGNFFSNTSGASTGAAVYVFDYASAMAGTGAPYTKISENSSFSLCPALTYDNTEANMFVVESWNGGAGQMRLWKISGPVATPVMTSIGYPTTTTHWRGSEPGGNDFGPQVGSTSKLDEGDNRTTNLTYRNHKLWCAHTVFLPSSGAANRSSIMWWQMDTLANPLQNGLIDDPTTNTFYAYPSIAVNQNDDALIGFANLSKLLHPSGGYALHLHTDPADSIRPTFIFRHGQATYLQKFGGTKNRWGDFSATCVDPRNDNDFWTIQESVPRSPANYWDTWWAYVQVCPAFSSFTIANHIVNIHVNDTITFVGTAPAGTTFTWSFGGGTATPGTGAGPQVVNWATTGWKYVTLTVSNGTCSSEFKDSVLVRNAAEVTELNTQNLIVNVLPNPNNGTFDILFGKPVSGYVVVKLLNSEGSIVYNHQLTATNGNTLSVATQNLAAGIYIANVYVDGNVLTKKIVISR